MSVLRSKEKKKTWFVCICKLSSVSYAFHNLLEQLLSTEPQWCLCEIELFIPSVYLHHYFFVQ